MEARLRFWVASVSRSLEDAKAHSPEFRKLWSVSDTRPHKLESWTLLSSLKSRPGSGEGDGVGKAGPNTVGSNVGAPNSGDDGGAGYEDRD